MSANHKVILKHAFGINTSLSNSICCVDEHLVGYICGYQVVIINTESKEQTFITSTSQQKTFGISGVIACPQKKTIAVSEICEPCGIVTLYDSQTLKRKKILQSNELGSRQIRCMAFSADGRYCAIQGADPEWNLLIWNIDKTCKVIGTVKISLSSDNAINHVSFCPWDNSAFIVVGKGVVRFFRIVDGSIKPLNTNLKHNNQNILCFTWLGDEKLLLGTDAGEILLFEKLEYRFPIYPSATTDVLDISPILSMSPVSKGFVAATGNGECLFFTLENESNLYKREEIFYLPNNDTGCINSLLLMDDDVVICTTDSQQLYSFVLHNASVTNDDAVSTNSITTSLTNATLTSSTNANNKSKIVAAISNANSVMRNSSCFDYLLTSFHCPNHIGESGINAVDIAVWKPIAATCGKDQTVRIWNIADRKSEIIKQFQDDPVAVALHPSGLYIVISFTDKIRIASILLDCISVTREISLRGCTAIKFSNGGALFSTVVGNIVTIFDTYSGSLVSTLRGHNSKIKAVRWLNYDAKILTIGSEGTTHLWTVASGVKAPDGHVGILPITAATAFRDGTKAYYTTNEKILKEVPLEKYIDATTAGDIPGRLLNDLVINTSVSVMLADDFNKVVFLASHDNNGPGNLVIVPTQPHLSTSFDSIPLHNSPIVDMCFNKSHNVLLSVDTKGCLLISEIEYGNSIQRKGLKLREGIASPNEFFDEVLISKNDLTVKINQIKELTHHAEELQLKCEKFLRIRESEYVQKIEDIELKFRQRLAAEKDTYDYYLSEIKEVEKSWNKDVTSMETMHEKDQAVYKGRYDLKLSLEFDRYKELEVSLKEEIAKWNVENQLIIERHEMRIAELGRNFEEKVIQEQETRSLVGHEKGHIHVKYAKEYHMMEADAEEEVSSIAAISETILKREEEDFTKLRKENDTGKETLAILKRDSDMQKETLKQIKEKETRLIETIRTLEKDIYSHKKDIREREETITDKEKRIFDLKKKNQELEKFRFVLDYKIKELQLQIAPCDHEITKMTRQITDMKMELQQYEKSNESLSLMIEESKLKLEGMRKELQTQTTRVDDNSAYVTRVMSDLQELQTTKHDNELLKEALISLFRNYIQNEEMIKMKEENKASRELGDGPQRQYNRDREQMEKSLDGLRRSLCTDVDIQKRDVAKMLRENVVLTSTLNELRKDAQKLHLQKSGLEQALEAGPNANIAAMVAVLGLSLVGKAKDEPQTEEPSTPRSEPLNIGLSSLHSLNNFAMPVAPTSAAPSRRSARSKMITSSQTQHSNAKTSSMQGGGATKNVMFVLNNGLNDGSTYHEREMENQTLEIDSLNNQIRMLCEQQDVSCDDIFRRIRTNVDV